MRRPACLLLLLALTSALPAPAIAQDLRLPFDGRWFVAQGGDTLNVNHHMAARGQLYGVDFLKTGGPGDRAVVRGDGSSREDYYGWEAPVRSPAAGLVEEAVGDLPDQPLGTKDAAHPFGNHVVVRQADDRHVVVAHLRQGSLSVHAGDRIAAGDLIGLCGNSGNTDAPHVHVHVQDRAGLSAPDATGRNPVFSHMDVEMNGARFPDITWPLIRGLWVEPHVRR